MSGISVWWWVGGGAVLVALIAFVVRWVWVLGHAVHVERCRELFRQFGLKLADLWRYEAGFDVPDSPVPHDDWANFQRVQERGRGVLLITPHIGNWEFGAPFLRKRGVALQVITQAEPQESLTNLRKASGKWIHAVVFDVSADGLHGRAIDQDGTIKDDFTVPAP